MNISSRKASGLSRFPTFAKDPRLVKYVITIIKGIIGLGELPFLFSLRHHLDHDLCAFLVREPMLQMIEQFH